jgi:hypothetical protein
MPVWGQCQTTGGVLNCQLSLSAAQDAIISLPTSVPRHFTLPTLYSEQRQRSAHAVSLHEGASNGDFEALP